jgi:hypothetical protein
VSNIFTEVSLQVAEHGSKKQALSRLWTCLNIIEDYSEKRRGDYKLIHRAIMAAQKAARELEDLK